MLKFNKNKTISCDGNAFKSNLELYFYFYLKELESNGYVTDISYETSTFILTEPYSRDYPFKGKRGTLIKSEHLLHKSSITADFTFTFLPKAEGIFYIGANPIEKLVKQIPFRLSTEDPTDLECLVEVKSVQERSATSSNTSFPYKVKFCLDKYNKLIHKVKPYSPQGRGCLFETTFTPTKVLEQEVYVKNCKYGNKGQSKIRYKIRSLDEYLNN